MMFGAYVTISQQVWVEVEADNFDEADERIRDYNKWDSSSDVYIPQVEEVEDLRRLE